MVSTTESVATDGRNGTSGRVIVTGGSGGIGSAVLRSLLADRIACVNVDLLPPPDDCSGAIFERCDLSDLNSIDAFCERMISDGTPISGIVHCAGVTQGGGRAVQGSLLEEEARENWLTILNVNLVGPIAMIQNLLPILAPNGAIIFFGSGTVLKGLPRYSVYIASKAGIVGFARSLAAELGDRSITVNTIAPGLTVTSMNDNVPAGQFQANLLSRAIKREEQPEDIVGAVRFFLSSAASFITGQMLVIDGGSTRH